MDAVYEGGCETHWMFRIDTVSRVRPPMDAETLVDAKSRRSWTRMAISGLS